MPKDMPELRVHITPTHTLYKEGDPLSLPTGLEETSQVAFLNDETGKGLSTFPLTFPQDFPSYAL